MQRLDRLASSELGIPGVVLMENAGRSVAEVIFDLLSSEPRALASGGPRPCGRGPETRVAILCGGGNNGGDGYVVARHLYNRGLRVAVFAASDPRRLTGDAAIHAAIIDKMASGRAGFQPASGRDARDTEGGQEARAPRRLECHEIMTEEQLNAARPCLEEADILVDALLGTGFSGDVRAPLAAVIRCCNELGAQGKKIVAVDVPSGLDCQTGQPSSATVRADVTVTFVALKAGFLQPEAKAFLGRVVIGGIGTPPELIKRVACG